MSVDHANDLFWGVAQYRAMPNIGPPPLLKNTEEYGRIRKNTDENRRIRKNAEEYGRIRNNTEEYGIIRNNTE